MPEISPALYRAGGRRAARPHPRLHRDLALLAAGAGRAGPALRGDRADAARPRRRAARRPATRRTRSREAADHFEAPARRARRRDRALRRQLDGRRAGARAGQARPRAQRRGISPGGGWGRGDTRRAERIIKCSRASRRWRKAVAAAARGMGRPGLRRIAMRDVMTRGDQVPAARRSRWPVRRSRCTVVDDVFETIRSGARRCAAWTRSSARRWSPGATRTASCRWTTTRRASATRSPAWSSACCRGSATRRCGTTRAWSPRRSATSRPRRGPAEARRRSRPPSVRCPPRRAGPRPAVTGSTIGADLYGGVHEQDQGAGRPHHRRRRAASAPRPPAARGPGRPARPRRPRPAALCEVARAASSGADRAIAVVADVCGLPAMEAAVAAGSSASAARLRASPTPASPATARCWPSTPPRSAASSTSTSPASSTPSAPRCRPSSSARATSWSSRRWPPSPPAPGLVAYNASKAGAEHFANALRPEVAHHGVKVGSAHMSWIDTPLVQDAKRDLSAFTMMLEQPARPARADHDGGGVREAFVAGIEGRAHAGQRAALGQRRALAEAGADDAGRRARDPPPTRPRSSR